MSELSHLRERARAAFVQHGFDERADDLANLLQLCLRLDSELVEDENIPSGASKLGGLPDLPEDFGWPIYKGEPLSFLGQIDLAEASRFPAAQDLPSTGLLSFFFAVEARAFGGREWRGGWIVRHVLGDDLRRTSSPAPHTFHTARLTLREDASLPMTEDLKRYDLDVGDAWERYLDALSTFCDGSSQLQTLGYPIDVNGGMQESCHIARNDLPRKSWRDWKKIQQATIAERWRLLLCLPTDDQLGMDWGDSGLIQFWITEADLLECRFEEVWLTGECS